DLFQFIGAARCQNDIGAGAGQRFRCKCAEGASRAGDQRRLALDIEQRQRILQEVFGHDGPHYFGGAATATRMVQTSLPRLMISRFSLGAMKTVSPGFATCSLPPAITVSSPLSTW